MQTPLQNDLDRQWRDVVERLRAANTSHKPNANLRLRMACFDIEPFEDRTLMSATAPTITAPSPIKGTEDVPLIFSSAESTQLSITDATAVSNGYTESVTLSADDGTLTLASSAGLTITSGSLSGSSSVSFTGSLSNVNNALNGLAYVPTPSTHGSATLNISVLDEGDSLSVSQQLNLNFQQPTAPTVAQAASASPGAVTGTSTDLSVLGADAAGEPTLTYTWSVTSEPGGALAPVFSANGTNAAKNTVATFSQAGSYQFLVTITDAAGLSTTSSVAVTVDQTITSIAVSPATSDVAAGQAENLTAVALDQFGHSMQTQPTFTWATDGGGLIGLLGQLTASLTAGTEDVTASADGVTGSATVDVVSAATATATPSPVTGTTTDLSVVGGFTFGDSFAWSVYSKPTGAASPTFGSASAQSTTATFSSAGNYVFEVQLTGFFSARLTVSVTVDQTLTAIAVSPNIASLNENQQTSFTAEGYDQFDSAMTTQPTFNWAVASGGGSITQSGTYTSPGSNHAGAVTISAQSGDVSGTANITVANAAPTVAIAASATPSPVTGSTTDLTVLGADDGGESNLTYSWASVGPASVLFSATGANAAQDSIATFSQAGSYVLTATITDAEGLSVTSTVDVTVDQTVSSISISPTSPTVTENTTQQFTLTETDQFGNAISSPTAAWSITAGEGAVNSSGLYTAPSTPGSAAVQAATNSLTATALVTVPNEPPTIAVAAHANPNPVTGTTTQLSVLGADDGGESNLTYTWSALGPASVSFLNNGANAGKNTTATFSHYGVYDITVQITDAGGFSTTDGISVTVEPTFSQIHITPSTAAVSRGHWLGLVADGYDQFGNLLVSQPTINWSITSGEGIIDYRGIYVAPDSGTGPVTIRATSGGISQTVTINLTNQLAFSTLPPQNVAPNSSLVFQNANAITLTDGDATSQSVPAIVSLTVTQGAIRLSQMTGLSFASGSNFQSMTFAGTLANINAALHGLTFTPTTGGPATLTATVDNSTTGAAITQSVVNINIPAPPPAPPAPPAPAPPAPPASPAPAPVPAPPAPPAPAPAPVIPPSPAPAPTVTIIDTTTTTTTDTTETDTIDSTTSDTSTVTTPDTDAAPAPASAAPSPTAPVQPAPAASHASAPAATQHPSSQNIVPDVRVQSIPEETFKFLAPQGPMMTDLDTVKTEMASEKSLKLKAGSATVVSLGASAAYFAWLLRGGSLLSSLLSMFPAWKNIDPIPVLENFENSRKRKRAAGENDSESLESIMDRSNESEQSLPPPADKTQRQLERKQP